MTQTSSREARLPILSETPLPVFRAALACFKLSLQYVGWLCGHRAASLQPVIISPISQIRIKAFRYLSKVTWLLGNSQDLNPDVQAASLSKPTCIWVSSVLVGPLLRRQAFCAAGPGAAFPGPPEGPAVAAGGVLRPPGLLHGHWTCRAFSNRFHQELRPSLPESTQLPFLLGVV